MFKLVISDDEGKQTVVPLVRDEITVGRKEGNTIRLTERNVSRRHARLVKANGKFVIEDLQSYNGVRVNGQRIGAETPLGPGDQITIGDYQLLLQADQAEATVPEQVSPAVANAETAMIASPGPPARLVMITPPAPGAEFALTSERVRIGRAEDLDVWVNHRSISREHAEIQKEPDGGLRLIDLGSANGVRVNGEDVQNALLSPGDVVELGQVRFRFVAAGEHYAFDADRTVQMDAVTVEPSNDNRKYLLMAGAILAVALLGAVVLVATWGGEDEVEPVVTPEATAPEEGGGAPAAADPDARYRAALEACQAAVERDDLAEARSQAQIALQVRPGDAAATQCQARAQSSQADLDTFDRGVRHFEAGRLAEAYTAFDSLPENSPLRQRSEVRRAIRSYAGMKLTEGESALEDDPGEALQIAQFVLAMVGLTPEQQARADRLRQNAEQAGGEEAAAAPEVADATAAGGGSRRPSRGRGSRGGTRRGRDTGAQRTARAGGASSGTSSTPRRGGGGSSESGGSAAGGGGANLDQQVRACVMRGDNNCIIRLLEGRARSQTQLAQLIEAYRARGQTNAAIRHMRTFVQRYRGTARARQYQQILARHN
jgi:pSer/pThr/pTyr-binding forkhead associated (FHA) protein